MKRLQSALCVAAVAVSLPTAVTPAEAAPWSRVSLETKKGESKKETLEPARRFKSASLQRQLEVELDSFIRLCGGTAPVLDSPVPATIWELWREPGTANQTPQAFALPLVVDAGTGLDPEQVFSEIFTSEDSKALLEVIKKKPRAWVYDTPKAEPPVTKPVFSFAGGCDSFVKVTAEGQAATPWLTAETKARMEKSKSAALVFAFSSFSSPLNLLKSTKSADEEQKKILRILLWEKLASLSEKSSLESQAALRSVGQFSAVPVALTRDEREVESFIASGRAALSFLAASANGSVEYGSNGYSKITGGVKRLLILGSVTKQGELVPDVSSWITIPSPTDLKNQIETSIGVEKPAGSQVRLLAGSGEDSEKFFGLPEDRCTADSIRVFQVGSGGDSALKSEPSWSKSDKSCKVSWFYSDLNSNSIKMQKIRVQFGSAVRVKAGGVDGAQQLQVVKELRRYLMDDFIVVPRIESCSLESCELSFLVKNAPDWTTTSVRLVETAKFSCPLLKVTSSRNDLIPKARFKRQEATLNCDAEDALDVTLNVGGKVVPRRVKLEFVLDAPPAPNTNP